jgi:hypothetical protein
MGNEHSAEAIECLNAPIKNLVPEGQKIFSLPFDCTVGTALTSLKVQKLRMGISAAGYADETAKFQKKKNAF